MLMLMTTYSTLTSSKVMGKGRRATVTAMGSHQEPLLTGNICVLWDKTTSRSTRNSSRTSSTTSTATTIPLLPVTVFYFYYCYLLAKAKDKLIEGNTMKTMVNPAHTSNQAIVYEIRRLEDKWNQNTSQNQISIVKRYLVTFPALKGETGDFCFLVIVIMTNL